MRISNNQFTKQNLKVVSGSFTDTLTKSSKVFSKRAFTKSNNTFQGDNTSETAYGIDDPYGGPDSTYGQTPYNGLAHFKLRPFYNLTH